MTASLSPRRRYICYLAASLFYAYEFFLRIQPGVITHELTRYFHIHGFGLAELASLYYLAYMLMQIPCGLLLDHFGLRRSLVFACGLCGLGCFVFVLTPSLLTAGLGRMMIGAGSAFSFIAVLTIARRYFPHQHFTLLSGIAVALGTLAGAYADIMVTYLLQILSWQAVTLLSGIAGLILMLIVWAIIPASTKAQDNIALRQQWQDCLPILRRWLLCWPLWCNGLTAGLAYLPTSLLVSLWGVPYLEISQHLSTQQASFATSLILLGWVVGSPLMGFLADHSGHYQRWLNVSLLFAALTALLFIHYTPMPSFFMLCALLFTFGFFSSAQVICWRIFQHIKPSTDKTLEYNALGIAIMNMIIMGSVAVFHLLVGAAIDWHRAHTTTHTTVSFDHSDLHFALTLLPGILLATAMIHCLRSCLSHKTRASIA